MILTIDTASPLSTTEQNLLKILLTGAATPAAATAAAKEVTYSRPALAKEVASIRPAPAPAPAPAAQAPAAAVEEPAPAAEPVVEEPSVLDEAPAEGDFTMAAAVSRATELVSAGKTARIREVLEGLAGAKRVSELKSPKAIESFLHALRND